METLTKIIVRLYENPVLVIVAIVGFGTILYALSLSAEDENRISTLSLSLYIPCLLAFVAVLTTGVMIGGRYLTETVIESHEAMQEGMRESIQREYGAEFAALRESNMMLKEETGLGFAELIGNPQESGSQIASGYNSLFDIN